MAKKINRRKVSRPKVSPTRLAALAERRELESARNLQRKIRRLAGELRRATIQADDALRFIARMVVERDMPTDRNLRQTADDLDPAAAGAALDTRV